jgi:hypothetical protein
VPIDSKAFRKFRKRWWVLKNIGMNILVAMIATFATLFGLNVLFGVISYRSVQNLLNNSETAANIIGAAPGIEQIRRVERLRNNGLDARVVFSPSTFVRHIVDPDLPKLRLTSGEEVVPLAGPAGQLSVLGKEDDAELIFEADEHGFNNPRGIWKSPKFDVGFLGDSFTQGASLPNDQNFVGRFRKAFTNTINLAVCGNGPLIELATAVEYLQHVKPKLTFWVYFEGNDLTDLVGEWQHPTLRRYFKDRTFRQNLLEHQEEIDGTLKAYLKSTEDQYRRGRSLVRLTPNLGWKDLLLMSNLRELYLVFANWQRGPDNLDQPVVEKMAEILGRVNGFVQSWNGTMIFVYVPAGAR